MWCCYMSAPFKEGDWVVCIQNSSCGGFVEGQSYEIRHVHESSIEIFIDSKGRLYNGWHNKFFKKRSRIKMRRKRI